jgi:hypothetical protein
MKNAKQDARASPPLGLEVVILCLLAFGLAGLIVRRVELFFSCITLAIAFRYSAMQLFRKSGTSRIFVVAVIASTVMCWCVGLQGYLYILSLSPSLYVSETSHTVLSAVLSLTAVVALILGCEFTHKVLNYSGRVVFFSGIKNSEILPYIIAFGILFVVYQIIFFATGGISSRWETGNRLPAGSVAYFLGGAKCLTFPFFAFLGCSLKSNLFSRWNILVYLIVLVIAFILGLTGGRTYALEPLALASVGALFSEIGPRKYLKLALIGAPLIPVIMVVVGQARGVADFSSSGLGQRALLMKEVATKGGSLGNEYDSSSYVIFSRIFEPSAQVVIDAVANSGRRVGFMNFERLQYLFVPKFIMPEKRNLSDGNERLVLDYGYYDSDFTANPLTLIADSYERGGVLFVSIYHLLLGAVLGALAWVVSRARFGLFQLALFVSLSRGLITLYSESVLGSFHVILYGAVRDFIILSVAFSVIHFAARSFSLGLGK